MVACHADGSEGPAFCLPCSHCRPYLQTLRRETKCQPTPKPLRLIATNFLRLESKPADSDAHEAFMKLKPFLLDMWLDRYEHGTEFNLAASTGPVWTVNELLELGGERAREDYLN